MFFKPRFRTARRVTAYRKRYPMKRRPFFKSKAKNLHPEYKYQDLTQAADASILDTGRIFNFPYLVTKGTGATDRVGEQIVIRSFYYRAIISAGSAALQGSPVRIIIGIDTQSNGSNVSSLASILQDTSNPLNSPLLQGTAQRYKILKDKVYVTDVDDPTIVIKGYKTMNTVVKYTSGSANPQTNNLFMIMVSNRAVANNPPQTTYYTRMRFTDD